MFQNSLLIYYIFISMLASYANFSVCVGEAPLDIWFCVTVASSSLNKLTGFGSEQPLRSFNASPALPVTASLIMWHSISGEPQSHFDALWCSALGVKRAWWLLNSIFSRFEDQSTCVIWVLFIRCCLVQDLWRMMINRHIPLNFSWLFVLNTIYDQRWMNGLSELLPHIDLCHCRVWPFIDANVHFWSKCIDILWESLFLWVK